MKLIAFNRGKAISADPIWMGTNRFVKPPKSAGIIRKKIIKKAWAHTVLAHSAHGLAGDVPAETTFQSTIVKIDFASTTLLGQREVDRAPRERGAPTSGWPSIAVEQTQRMPRQP